MRLACGRGPERLAQFVSLEIKTDSGTLSPEQRAFLRLVRQLGGLRTVCRSIAQAQAVLALDYMAGTGNE